MSARRVSKADDEDYDKVGGSAARIRDTLAHARYFLAARAAQDIARLAAPDAHQLIIALWGADHDHQAPLNARARVS